MPRVIGPMLSLDASGTFGCLVCFTKWKGQNRTRMWVSPYQPRTDAQKANRANFYRGVHGWQSLDAAGKAIWNTHADSVSDCHTPLSGFNAFMGEYIKAGDFPSAPGAGAGDSPYA